MSKAVTRTEQSLDPVDADNARMINIALSRIREGAPKSDSMIGAGIYKETWKSWQDKAKAGDADCVKLMRRIDQAYAEARAGAVAEVRLADPKLWLSRAGNEPSVAGEPGWADAESAAVGAAGSVDIVQLRATLEGRFIRLATAGIAPTSDDGDGDRGAHEAAIRLVDVGEASGADRPAEIQGPDAAAEGSDFLRDLDDHDRTWVGQDADGRGDDQG